MDETKVLLAFMKALAGGDAPSDQAGAQPPRRDASAAGALSNRGRPARKRRMTIRDA